jgi:2-oxoisovalerate dehydrogenase E2 component (dihydrolipoyl transacylase)
MAELRQFRLPDVGEGLTEADIVKWHVQPGDTVTINQTIVEIETAKAVVELPSPYAGVVTDLLVAEGVTADVGTPIIAIEVGGGAAGGGGGAPATVAEPAVAGTEEEREAGLAADLVPEPPPNGGEPEPAPGKRQAVLVGYGAKAGTTKRRARKAAAQAQPAAPVAAAGPAVAAPAPAAPPAPAAVAVPAGAGTSAAPAPTAGDGPVLAKPPVRKLAKDLGVDLAALTGTGPNGSITRDDVQSATAPTPPAAVPATRTSAPGAREERIAIRGVRKHTAAAMTASAFTAPHVTMFLEIDITETMAATARLRDLPDFAGLRVSPLLLVARALLIAAARHPMINSTWDEAAQEIVVRHYVNLGIAAATERGLVVPNIKDADALSLPALARALGELADAARAGKSTPADLAGGTVSITNVGVFGVDTGTPILPPGETAILAFGQVKQAPWVHGGELAVRQVCTLAMSFDHRVVDGDLGAAVLRDVGAMLTDPLRMLAWA